MISKEFLIEEYINKEKAMNEIAREYDIAVGSVYNYLKKYGIQSRPKMTKKTREKISKAHKGKVSPMKDKKMSVETRLKISKSLKGKYRINTKYGGHIKHRKDGYTYVFCPDNANASKDGYVMEHILVMQEYIKRPLAEDEVVHHKNKIRNDNRIENLQLMTFKEHARMHMKERQALKKKGLMTYQ